MKKIIYTGCAIVAALLLGGCEDFLDTKSYTMKDTSNFPTTTADAEMALTGIYSTLSDGVRNAQLTSFFVSEIASDDRFGGGGTNDSHVQAINRFMNFGPLNTYYEFWRARYSGIYRANQLFETIDNVTGWESEEQKNQVLGETYFLRAMYYFDLSQMFGEVPLVLTSVSENMPKVPADQTYGQIASDLKNAITLMPSVSYSSTETGRATKWAAEALMARVFLFYTGYYAKDAITLSEAEGGSIDKVQVIAWLEDCINNSGHDLVGDFRELWPYTNPYTVEKYPYTQGQNLKWAGDGNKETVFAIKFGINAAWGDVYSTNPADYILGFSNQYNLFFGLRQSGTNNGLEQTFPFGGGWGCGPVNTGIWNDWRQAEPNDMRREASILNAPAELPDYGWNGDQMYEETGYWQKKYIQISAYNDNTWVNSYTQITDGAKPDMQINNTQDLVLIRFADVLLMHSELKQDAAGMNRVRARAKLPSVSYSLDALKKERRWELAFEGLRYFDLMRWGDAAAVLDKQAGITIKNNGADALMKGNFSARYAATGGFWPIPSSQIDLSNGILLQNKGWDTPDANFTSW